MNKFVSKLWIGIFAVVVLQIASLTNVIAAGEPAFGGGDGFSTPYLVSSCEHIQDIDYNEVTLNSWYLVTQDLDCTSFGNNIMVDSYNNGEELFYFSGNFDGDGHTITYAIEAINEDLPVGLFRSVNEAYFQKLDLVATVSSDYGFVGSLVGYDHGDSVYEVITAEVAVSGTDYVGGLIGTTAFNGLDNQTPEILDIQIFGTVNGTGQDTGGLVGNMSYTSLAGVLVSADVTNTTGDNTGGIAGYASDVTIVRTSTTGNITGDNNVGGLLGYSDGDDSVRESYAAGDINGRNNVGGLVGKADDGVDLFEVFSLGDVTGVDNIGGLVGYMNYDSIINAYARGNITGASCVGGLIGEAEYFVEMIFAYSSGQIIDNADDAFYAGGILGCGDEGASIFTSFWDSELEGNPQFVSGNYEDEYTASGVGITTTALNTLDTFISLGEGNWCFELVFPGCSENDPFAPWAIDSLNLINDGYPYFGWSEEFLSSIDTTAPIVELINDDEITNNTATIYYDFNEVGSTYIEYGFSNEYGQTTGTVLTEEPNQEVYFVIEDLVACSTYFYRLVATDESDNTAYSEGYFFTTTGCIQDYDHGSSSGGSSSGSSSGSRSLKSKLNSAKIEFTDTKGHWAEEYIDDIAGKCKIQGYKDANGNLLKKFGPDDEMLRAEFVEILTQCRFGDELPVPTVKPFPDVEISDWYAPALSKALNLDWISGYGLDGLFRPLQTISRAEATKILVLSEFKESELENIAPDFSDMPAEYMWYTKYVANAVKKGYISGYENGAFGPDDNLLRGQAAKIISKLMEVYNY